MSNEIVIINNSLDKENRCKNYDNKTLAILLREIRKSFPTLSIKGYYDNRLFDDVIQESANRIENIDRASE